MRQAVSTPGGPPAIGPYSPAIRAGNLLFLSGQIPVDPSTGAAVVGDIRVQTRRVMDNIADLLKAGGATFAQVARCTVFLADMADFAGMNEVYASYVGQPAPARSTVQVAKLPKDVKVEIDVIAVIDA